MQKAKCLIVGGGRVDLQQLSLLAQEADTVIGVDKGCEALWRIKKYPETVLGDMDSISQDILKEVNEKKIKIITYPSQKDDTDMALAIDLAVANGMTKIWIVGGTGTRMDHSMGNLFLLNRYPDKDISIIDSHNKICLLDKSITIHKKDMVGKWISLFAWQQRVSGLTLKGFAYPLSNYSLEWGEPLIISNYLVEEKGEISFEAGQLLMMETID